MKPQVPPQKVVNPRKLILHFDVNKTIMVSDASEPTSKEIIVSLSRISRYNTLKLLAYGARFSIRLG